MTFDISFEIPVSLKFSWKTRIFCEILVHKSDPQYVSNYSDQNNFTGSNFSYLLSSSEIILCRCVHSMSFDRIFRRLLLETSTNSPLYIHIRELRFSFPSNLIYASYSRWFRFNENNNALSMKCNFTSCSM